MNSSLAQTHPATQSLVPLMYFVRLWTTISAPKRIGDKIIGLNVLSTTSFSPFVLLIAASPGISETSNKRIAHRFAVDHARLVVDQRANRVEIRRSTKWTLMPNRGRKFLNNAYVPP